MEPISTPPCVILARVKEGGENEDGRNVKRMRLARADEIMKDLARDAMQAFGHVKPGSGGEGREGMCGEDEEVILGSQITDESLSCSQMESVGNDVPLSPRSFLSRAGIYASPRNMRRRRKVGFVCTPPRRPPLTDISNLPTSSVRGKYASPTRTPPRGSPLRGTKGDITPATARAAHSLLALLR